MTTDSRAHEDVTTRGWAHTPFNLVPNVDEWTSVTGRSAGIPRFIVRRRGNTVTVQAYGADGGPRPGDWGEVEAEGIFTTPTNVGYALSATFDGPETSTTVQTTMVQSIVAMHAFTRHTDGSGRRDFYTREFYVRLPAGESLYVDHTDAGFPQELRSGANDPATLLGTWKVLDQKRQISRFELGRGDDGFTARAFGPEEDDPVDWGERPMRLYTDVMNPASTLSFLTEFDHDDRRVYIQARYYLGALVVSQYTVFTDDSNRINYFLRDFFRH